MIWESSLIQSHQRLIQQEFDDARKLFDAKDRKARLIENDVRRNAAAHGARNHYIESLLSLQLRAKKHFCFRELKLLTETINRLQGERRREAEVNKAVNPNIILDGGWKVPMPRRNGEEITDQELFGNGTSSDGAAVVAITAATDADDWYVPKPQPSKKVLAAKAAALERRRRKRDEAEAMQEAMDKAADISSGVVRRVGDNYAWFNTMPDR